MRLPGPRLLASLAVVVAAVALAVPRVTGPVRWQGTDALFYQAQSLELRGDSPTRARQAVISGHPGRSALAADRRSDPRTARLLASAGWRRYSSQFYRRRWVVSALTALIAPLFGERSLLLVSAAGYILCGLLLHALLARRFGAVISGLLALAFLLAPPVRDNLLHAGTDSWGLALMLGALLLGLTALERGGVWIVGWFLCLAALSVTREDGIVAVVAALWVAVRRRERRATAVAATGVVATLPAGLLLGAPLLKSLAYVENGFRPPPSTALSYVINHYLGALRSTVRGDLDYVTQPGWGAARTLLWYAVLIVLAAGLVALLSERTRDPYYQLMRGVLLGAVVYILLSVNYTALRLELVFVPPLAVGVAVLAQRLWPWARSRTARPGDLPRVLSPPTG